MRVYARPGWRLARQLTSDLFVLGWIALWWTVAALARRAVDALAVPAQKSADAARALEGSMADAKERLATVPMAGDRLGEPFGSMSGNLAELASQAEAQVELIHRVATVTGVLTFAIPVLVVVALWLPRRVRFVRQAAAARRFIDADADLNLFALRAMSNVPMAKLASVSADPVAAWRAGDQQVIRALAALELERTGLAMPEPVRSTVQTGSPPAQG